MRLRPASEDRDHCIEIYILKKNGRFVEKGKPPPMTLGQTGKRGTKI